MEKKKTKKEIKMENLLCVFSECYNDLVRIGIPVAPRKKIIVKTGNFKNNFGLCRQVLDEDGYSYVISIPSDFDKANDNNNFLKHILIHEILHTCADCCNHEKKYMEYAEKIKEKNGMNVMDASDGFEHAGDEAILTYVCPVCGGIFRICDPDGEDMKWAELKKDFQCPCGYKMELQKSL